MTWIAIVLLLVCVIFEALAIHNLLKAVESHNKTLESIHDSLAILRDAVFPE